MTGDTAINPTLLSLVALRQRLQQAIEDARRAPDMAQLNQALDETLRTVLELEDQVRLGAAEVLLVPRPGAVVSLEGQLWRFAADPTVPMQQRVLAIELFFERADMETVRSLATNADYPEWVRTRAARAIENRTITAAAH